MEEEREEEFDQNVDLNGNENDPDEQYHSKADMTVDVRFGDSTVKDQSPSATHGDTEESSSNEFKYAEKSSLSLMDMMDMNKYIKAWLAKNAERANNLSVKIPNITDEYFEICIGDKDLQIAIPHNFYTSCSSDGIISNIDCAFIATLTHAKSNDCDNIHTG